MHEILLASTSPRRRELLDQIGVPYRLLEVEVCEDTHAEETPEIYVLRLALAKARAGRSRLQPQDKRLVLGADTAVVLEGVVLGKPENRQHGLDMLERLAGRTHQVLTAVALVGADGEEETRLSVSAVTFRNLTLQEREAYWETGEPADKAGGYGIQGKGAVFVEHIDGSYSGVMGLPLFETAELLSHFGYSPVFNWNNKKATA